MLAESSSPAISRLSCFSNMNDSQNSNNFDFVPKSDYNEKWHLENKCLFHNQQFLGGDVCGLRKSCARFQVTCDSRKRSDDKFKVKTGDGNALNQKSGDWKYDEEIIEHTTGNLGQEPLGTDWRWKNPYSISSVDRSNRWDRGGFNLENNLSTELLRDVYNKADNRYEDLAESDTEKNFLHNFREYLVNYQESHGVPRTEYSFSALIRIMGQATGRSLLALLYVMMNIVPVVEVFLYVLRFILDKVISIKSSKDLRHTTIRCFVFMTELLSIYICLIFIFGFIVLPIMQMIIGIVAKILLYN